MLLTDEQKNVAKSVVKNIDSEQITTLAGYAGTGKTTLVKVIKDALKMKGLIFASCAYTGKATNVLCRKGIRSSTIHGTIYEPMKDDKDNVVWYKKHHSHPDISEIDGFIVDEASMVSKEIHFDLLSYGKPIIYVGDHGQLEPIGTDFNLMKNPKFRLEKILRNAGEIAHFAEHLRKGNPSTTFKASKLVQIVRDTVVLDKHLVAADQIVCAFNKTRVQINERIRRYHNIEFAHITAGEKIICLRNNSRELLYNGMQGIVTKIKDDDHFDFVSDGMEYNDIHYDCEQFGQETNQFTFTQKANPFDFGYGLTAHKVQGSEFGKGVVYEQKCQHWDHVRWAYTAASRFKRGLLWILLEDYIPKYLR